MYHFQAAPSTASNNAATSLNNGEINPSVSYSRTPQGTSDATAEETITLLGAKTSAGPKPDATDPAS